MRYVAYISFFLLFTTRLCAQPSPAFDKNVYLPRIGVPGEIDTVMGGNDTQALGSRIRSVPSPMPDSSPSILIMGLPESIPFLTAIATGSNFNVHKLDVRKTLDLNDQTIIRYGHFHDTRHYDLFSYNPDGDFKIYWQDDSGFYSENKMTRLVSYSGQGGGSYTVTSNAYTAYLTSDTVEDIIFIINTTWVDFTKDTSLILLYQGGTQLAQKIGNALPDSSYDLKLYGQDFERYGSQGDWRGAGREDLIMADNSGNAFYYHNDRSKPFSLAGFYNALRFDTLFAVWQNPHFNGTSVFPWQEILTMKALPKVADDKSLDLVLSAPTDDWRNGGVWFFRGASDFGTHRITLDSAVYVIRHPQYYDPTAFNNMTFPTGIINCGDMTGTGNNVILVGGALDQGYTALAFFYVTGEALDDKVDMYYLVAPNPGGVADTLTANTDNMEDLLIGHYGLGGGEGALFLLYGSKKIPVRINVVKENPLQNQSVYINPNIFSNATTVTLITGRSETITIIIRDVLGRAVYEEKHNSIGGTESIALHLPSLPSGRYFLQVVGADIFASSPLTIMR